MALFADTIGLNVKYDQGEAFDDTAKAMLKELKVRWVRDHVPWHQLEPEQGVFVALRSELQERVEWYRDNGIGLMVILAYQNPAYFDDPAYAQDRLPAEPFGQYALHAAKLLKQIGVEFVLEVWNEPRNFYVLPSYGGQWNGAEHSLWLDHYLEMANSAVTKVKEFDPSIEVIIQDDLWVAHYWYLENTNPAPNALLDGSSMHPYVSGSMEWTPFNSTTNWTHGPWGSIVGEGEPDHNSTISAAQLLRERWQLKVGHQPTLWVTEMGYRQGTEGEILEAAERLPRAFIASASAGFKGLCYFSSMDATDGPMGLRDNAGNKRLSYHAFQTMVNQLSGYEWQSVDWGSKENNWLISHTFLRPGDGAKKVVFWKVSWEYPSNLAVGPNDTAVDYIGNPIATSGGIIHADNGPTYLSMSVGAIPIRTIKFSGVVHFTEFYEHCP